MTLSTSPRPIARARAARFWTQSQLAKRAGVSVATVIRAEDGQTVSLISQARLATALGMSLDELFPVAEEAAS